MPDIERLHPIFRNITENLHEEEKEEEERELVIPTPSIVTYNVRSLSAYSKGKAYVSYRRSRIILNIIALSKTNDIIHLQETKLLPGDTLALSLPALSGWKKYYSSKGEKSGGCVTLVSPSLSTKYHISQNNLDKKLDGHALALEFVSKQNTVHSFLDINLYLYAGADQTKKADMLDLIINNIDRQRFVFVSGDSNLIDSPHDTSSDTNYHTFTDSLFNSWNNFLDHFRLREITQSTHTYYHITKNLINSRTSRLDRHYISFTETDLAVTMPDATIAAVPHSVLSVYGQVTAEELTELKMTREQMKLKRRSAASDHVPVQIRFHDAAREHSNSPRIPVWIAEDPRFARYFDIIWSSKEESMGAEDGYDKLMDFKYTLYKASEALLDEMRAEKAKPTDDLSQFNIEATLLRHIQRVDQDHDKIDRMIKRHPYLNDLTTNDKGHYTDTNLREHMADLLYAYGTTY